MQQIFYDYITLYARSFETAKCWWSFETAKYFIFLNRLKNILLRIVIDAIEDEGQDLRENIDVRIQASTDTLDHQHAENHAAEGSVLLDSMMDHRGE